jgi:hypothetical protein
MAFGTSQLTELSSAEVRMPATPYLDDLEVDPETKRVLAGALEKTSRISRPCRQFRRRNHHLDFVELAMAGECNLDLLCEGALKNLSGHLYSD